MLLEVQGGSSVKSNWLVVGYQGVIGMKWCIVRNCEIMGGRAGSSGRENGLCFDGDPNRVRSINPMVTNQLNIVICFSVLSGIYWMMVECSFYIYFGGIQERYISVPYQ